MKKFFLIFLIAIIVANAYGQTDFPISNAIWNVKLDNRDLLYAATCDTSINDITYSKLVIIDDTIITNEISSSQVIGFIRNDNQKVLLLFDNVEMVLYDFSKTIGDTIWHNAYLRELGLYEVHESANYISIINNKYVENGIEKYEVSTGFINDLQYMDIWINGVGSERGLFQHLLEMPMCASFYDNNLMCLKHNDTVKYLNDPRCSKCFCGYDTSEISNETADNSISIYPNPACNSISIEVEKEYTELTIEIMDEMGKLVYSNNEIDNPISLDGFAVGFYFVQLNIDGKITTEKIVVGNN